jgi:membrane protein DedA with SNARE-associated domain
MRLRTFLALDLLGSLLWAGVLVGFGYLLGQHAVDVAHTVTHYSLWVTIVLVAAIVVGRYRQARRGA